MIMGGNTGTDFFFCNKARHSKYLFSLLLGQTHQINVKLLQLIRWRLTALQTEGNPFQVLGTKGGERPVAGVTWERHGVRTDPAAGASVCPDWYHCTHVV